MTTSTSQTRAGTRRLARHSCGISEDGRSVCLLYRLSVLLPFQVLLKYLDIKCMHSGRMSQCYKEKQNSLAESRTWTIRREGRPLRHAAKWRQQWISAGRSVWSWWSCIYHEFKDIYLRKIRNNYLLLLTVYPHFPRKFFLLFVFVFCLVRTRYSSHDISSQLDLSKTLSLATLTMVNNMIMPITITFTVLIFRVIVKEVTLKASNSEVGMMTEIKLRR